MKNYKYLEDKTRVRFSFYDGGESLYGEVVGIALVPMPVVGASYIIKLDEDKLIKTHPYSCVVVQECRIDKIFSDI